VRLLEDVPNLVVMRTLSKAFGLAGIHTGFCLASPEIIRTLQKVRNPYPVPSPCADIGLQALSDSGLIRLSHNITEMSKTRSEFTDALSQLPRVQSVLPSSTNFVAGRFSEADLIADELKQKRFYIRLLPKMFDHSGWLRFSIGTSDHMRQIVSLLS